jgi:peptidoglycan L-alanyl-D-glutamate endopeptidase CwlK
MPIFGKTSRERLETCHPDIQEVLNEAIKHYDFVVVCGHRNKEEQDKAYAQGLSKARWPDSKHNTFPSMAVDVAPYDASKRAIDWNDRTAFARLAGFIQGLAAAKGIKLRYGGDWDGDGIMEEEKFRDLPHLEISE